MYDLHTHVLPGVDDGAQNMRVALTMLEQAIAQGITHVACTPHLNDRANFETDRHFQSVFLKLKTEVESLGLAVELQLGSEIMLGTDLQQLFKLKSSTYGGLGNYFLLEFPLQTPREITINAIRAARRWGKQPVIAHVERFTQAVKSIEDAKALREAGAILSLDAGALVNQFGPVMTTRAKRLLEGGCVDMMMSDAHDDASQGFCLKKAMEAASEWVGEPEARKLVLDHPRLVWENLPWPYVLEPDQQK